MLSSYFIEEKKKKSENVFKKQFEIGRDQPTALALVSVYRNDDVDVDGVNERFARLSRKFNFAL